MKIRIGFVSNSSSSSFVIVGAPIKLKYITAASLKSGKFMFRTDFEGNEGTVYGTITSPEMLEFVKKNNFFVEDVYEVFAFQYDSDEIDISSINIPKGKKAKIVSGIMDQATCDSIEELKEYYLENDDRYQENPNHVILENTEDGHNKFYEMTNLKNGKFTVKDGVIGASFATNGEYPIERWDEIYKDKIKKRYVQVEP
ncbi:MAG: hypothetical protein Q7R33_05935 [Nitrosarchaeum sp.]|nr:hypothetical protein [Nitrosarchaeum sp.]